MVVVLYCQLMIAQMVPCQVSSPLFKALIKVLSSWYSVMLRWQKILFTEYFVIEAGIQASVLWLRLTVECLTHHFLQLIGVFESFFANVLFAGTGYQGSFFYCVFFRFNSPGSHGILWTVYGMWSMVLKV